MDDLTTGLQKSSRASFGNLAYHWDYLALFYELIFFSLILLDGVWISETSFMLTIIIGIFLVVTIPLTFGKYNRFKNIGNKLFT